MRFITSKLLLIYFFICTFFNLQAQNIYTSKTINDIVFTKEEIAYIKKHKTIKTAMMSNFKPFSYIENGIHQGFTVDLLEHISQNSGISFEIKTDKWAKNLSDFKNSDVDMIAGISYIPKREEFTLFTQAYYEIPTYIFGLKSDKHYKSIEDLKNKKVAVSKSMYYKDELIKKGINIVEVSSSNEKAKLLALGKIDYFLATYTSGKKAIISQSITSIKPLDEFRGVKKEDLRFGITKDNAILQSIIQKSLEAIPTNTKTQLKEKWILKLKELTNKNIGLTQLEKSYLLAKEKITYCIDPNWMPFEKINKFGEHIGLTKDYMNTFQDKLNIPIKLIKTDSWNQSLEYFENKKCEVISLVTKTPNRIDSMNFTKHYINTPLVLATKLNEPFIEDISKIENKNIAVVENYAYVELLKRKYPNLNFVNVPNIQEGLKQVSKEKVFALVDSLPTIGYEIQSNYLGDLKIGAKFDEKLTLGMAVNKQDTILPNILNKLLNNISEEQRKKLLNKHIDIKYEKNFNYTLMSQILFIVALLFSFLMYRSNIQQKNNQILKESNRKMQTILDTTLVGIIISKNGLIEDVNQEILKLLNYDNKKELKNKNMLDIVDKTSLDEIEKRLQEDFTSPYELTLKRKDGSVFQALIRGKNIKINDSKYRISSVMDLTEMKEKEALIVQQSKVATAGEMLENISHQWRQPLSKITTIATGIKVQKKYGVYDDEKLLEAMDSINDSSQYLSQTIEDFKDFLKPNSQNYCEIDLNNTVQKVKQLTKDVYKYNNIELIIKEDDCRVIQNENLLIQALLNISNNAKDAIIENREKKSDPSYIFIEVSKDENWAFISIKDNGGGIEESIINRVFEPYFTTKHESVGTGIGLYMTYQIISKQLKGKIQVKNDTYNYNNENYTGASFIVKLPLN